MTSDIFGEPLLKDPAVALPAVTVHPKITPGPVRKQQLVIELVGPRTVPAQTAKTLLDPQWFEALGEPQVFIMSGSDQFWRELTKSDASAAYDSIALAWDLISTKGHLSGNSAQHLWTMAEEFAKQVQRRAMAMPVPADIAPTIQALQQLKESLDIGMNLTLVPCWDTFQEKEVWRVAAALGLEYAQDGSFEYKAAGSDYPLFSLSPADADRFSLAQVQANTTHPALGLGFSVPLCPDPATALNACFHTAEVFKDRADGALVDEDYKPVDDAAKVRITNQLQQAVDALNRAGFTPGSTEAIKLFGSP